MTYRAVGLAPDLFRPFFAMTDEQLAAHGAVRQIADRPGAYPCRIALDNVSAGEELILLNFEHHATPASPYRARGPIFVSRSAQKQQEWTGSLPPMMRDSLLSMRAYDSTGFILEADVVEGDLADVLVRRLFENPQVAFIHAHFARRGCFAVRIERA